RTKVLLKLRSHGTILSPVPRVVRAHGQFIDRNIFFPGGIVEGKKLHREHPSDTKFGGNLFTESLSALFQFSRNMWRRCDSLGTNTVALHGFGQRPRRNLAGWRARYQNGKLTGKRYFFFSHQWHATTDKIRNQRG